MALTVRHAFTSAKADSSDATVIQPSNWNANHTVTDDSLIIVPAAFTAQSPGGSLTAGITNTITLTPVPKGVNGSDTGHYLYISGGTGTAEKILITGGTAVSEAASGTITFVPANNHSGAWTIRTATSGIQEAIQQAITAGQGDVYVPAGIHTNYASIILPNNLPLSLRGAGIHATKIILANSVNVDVITNLNFSTLTGSNTQPAGIFRVTIHDLTVDGNKSNQTSGWGIRLYGHGYSLTDISVQNTKSGGIYGEYAYSLVYTDTERDTEVFFTRIRVIFSDGSGIVFRGPHDSFMTDIIVYRVGVWGIKFETDGSTYNGNCFINHSDTYLCALTDSTAGGVYSNVSIRGTSNTFTTATGYGLYSIGQTTNLSGVFGNADATKPGVHLGSNNNRLTGSIGNGAGIALKLACQQSIVEATFYALTYLLDVSADTGHNYVKGTAQGSGNYGFWTGTPHAHTDIELKNITSTAIAGSTIYAAYKEYWKKYNLSITGGTWTLKSDAGTSTVAGAAAVNQTITLESQVGNYYITGLVLKTSTAFTGAATAVVSGFGTNYSNTFYYGTNYDLKAAVAGDNFAPTNGALAAVGNSRLVDLVDIVVRITTTGANVSALVGVFDIWMRMTRLP